jgi:CHASE2 domain-containing sensor protein
MPVFEWLGEPRTLVLLAFLAVLTVVFGRIRREPPLAVAASTVGAVMAWAALFWAGSLGRDAMTMLLLAVVGVSLIQFGSNRAKAHRAARIAASQPQG